MVVGEQHPDRHAPIIAVRGPLAPGKKFPPSGGWPGRREEWILWGEDGARSECGAIDPTSLEALMTSTTLTSSSTGIGGKQKAGLVICLLFG
ncbi:MAG TPA: hypothetical protein PL137_21085, partial [Nocardioides sp.]|nr:hypothetical protein [Nocardioides sp.]